MLGEGLGLGLGLGLWILTDHHSLDDEVSGARGGVRVRVRVRVRVMDLDGPSQP